MSEDLKIIELNDEEVSRATVLLNLRLRKATGDSDFAGNRRRASLSKTEAVPLNRVYRQISGRDHPEFVKAFGASGEGPIKPTKKLSLDTSSRRALLSEVSTELTLHPRVVPTYRAVLEAIAKKLG